MGSSLCTNEVSKQERSNIYIYIYKSEKSQIVLDQDRKPKRD